MTDASEATAQNTMRSWLLLMAAVVGFVVAGSGYILLGALMLVGLVCIAPPAGASWRPIKALPVLAIYVPFALLWLGFAIAYLRVCEVAGCAIEPQSQLLALAQGSVSGAELWAAALVIVLLAPLLEEILFRGYLFAAVRSTLPLWGTHLVTATLFGLVHGIGHALPIGVLSLLFGYLRQRYGSLLPAILAHAVHNGVTLALVLTWPELLDLFYNR